MILAVSLILAPSLSVGEETREWQIGKVLDANLNHVYAGTVGDVSTRGEARASGNRTTYEEKSDSTQTAVYRTYNTVVIEGETHGYIARQRKRFGWSRLANLTVNGPVKFAVAKRNLYLIDDEGKEHKLEIVKQVLKPKPAEQKH